MWEPTLSRRRVLALTGATATAGCGSLPVFSPDVDVLSGSGVWPTTGYDAAKTNANTDAVGPQSAPEIAWRKSKRKPLPYALLVGRDAVYVLTSDGLHAYAKADGTRRWTHGNGYDVMDDAGGLGRDFALAEKFAAVSWGDDERSQVHGIDPTTGERRWRLDLDIRVPRHGITVVGPPNVPAIVEEGVLAANSRGDVFGIAPDGLLGASQRWHYVPPSDERTQRKTRVAANDDLVVGVKRSIYQVGEDKRHHSSVVGLDASNGEVRWRFGTPGDVSSVALGSDYVYLHTQSSSELVNPSSPPSPAGERVRSMSYLFALAPESGLPHRRLDFEASLYADGRFPFSGEQSLVVESRAVYVPMAEAVIALSPDLADEYWRTPLKGVFSTAASARTLYAVTGRTLVALDKQTGDRRWEFDCPTESPRIAAVTDRTVYLRDSDLVYAVREP